MSTSSSTPPTVTMGVRNGSGVAINVVLEPWGEIHSLQPGETRTLSYEGDPEPSLTIDLGETEIKVWAEGDGVLAIGPTAD